ncbi:phenylacetate--CoA ligase family protein [Yeosuana sp. MJ-SS3]|uniref:Phenylacetate--CoA ligase family protein n=1 Tax=Gilvirhabdus luticola TaxID=3079858 RepID=A0ABU3U2K1_9FLAO|nr:phenylacetate--CoA ligase family protein [Yeosuana sp. MJ-SS3]MDU8884635.1 phenylacetate--CoA ligase family protein [Yeosuana sp. MJ-SS3]
MNLFDFSLQINGFPIRRAKLFLDNIQKLNEEEFKNYIETAKKDILSHHLKENQFYKSFAKNVNINDWLNVPVMTKRDLQQPLKQRLSNKYNAKNVYVNKTSGSSGDPFIFAKDKFCHALTWAVIQNRFGWFGLNFNTSKQARFYGIPLDKKGYYKERLKDFFSNRIRFSVFNLGDSEFENVFHSFINTKFKYINGYTSPIVQFAKFLQKKEIVLTNVCPTLEYCFVTSEMLFEEDKVLMQEQFGVPVINEYGASELDLIAFDNPENEWQINNETLLVEILDEQNNVLPFGKEGRVVITSLYNKAHPFIRYDIGDVGVLSEKSTLKKPILETLIGRTNDIAILPSGKKAAGLTFYYITKSIIEDDGHIKEFVIEQLKIDTFKINYSGEIAISNDKKAKIITAMENYLEKGLHIIFKKQDTIQRSKSGKLKQFISLMK